MFNKPKAKIQSMNIYKFSKKDSQPIHLNTKEICIQKNKIPAFSIIQEVNMKIISFQPEINFGSILVISLSKLVMLI